MSATNDVLSRTAWDYQERHGLTDGQMAELCGFEHEHDYANLRSASNAPEWTVGQSRKLDELTRGDGEPGVCAVRPERVIEGVA